MLWNSINSEHAYLGIHAYDDNTYHLLMIMWKQTHALPTEAIKMYKDIYVFKVHVGNYSSRCIAFVSSSL